MAISPEFDEKVTNAMLTVATGKSYDQRMRWILYFINKLANLEGAADCNRSFMILSDCCKKLEDHIREVEKE